MSSGLGLRRRRKKKKPDSGARLVPLEIDGHATEELFGAPAAPANAGAVGEFVIDLPTIEKADGPLPRRLDAPRRHLPTRSATNRRES
jgi:hypothetical protein